MKCGCGEGSASGNKKVDSEGVEVNRRTGRASADTQGSSNQRDDANEAIEQLGVLELMDLWSQSEWAVPRENGETGPMCQGDSCTILVPTQTSYSTSHVTTA